MVNIVNSTAKKECISEADPLIELVERHSVKVQEFWRSGGNRLLLGLSGMENQQRAVEIAEVVFNFVDSELFQPRDLAKLVRSFQCAPTHSARVGAEYGVSASYAGWENFVITFHDKINELGEEDNERVGLSHYVAHEIAHSVIEIAKLQVEQVWTVEDEHPSLLKILTNINEALVNIGQIAGNSSAETALVQYVDRKAHGKFETERLAEVLGMFIASGGQQENFIYRRLKAIPPETIGIYFHAGQEFLPKDYRAFATAEGLELIEKTKVLFEVLENNWQSIMENVRSVDIDASTVRDQYDEELLVPRATVDTSTSSSGMIGSHDKVMDTRTTIQPPKQPSSPTPGQQPHHGEGFLLSLKSFVAAFAMEVGGPINSIIK